MIIVREYLHCSFCRSCGEPILWVRTAAGKMMPLDAVPRVDGNVMREFADGSRLYYVSHFATCPNAASHRRESP